MYLQRFRTANPFSLPFTFHIENTWVSLALREDSKHLQSTEDHAHLLNSAFEKAKMLIIEGKPASGKTCLMRRLAYEWANGKQELSHYDLIMYAEFREVREQKCERIADIVLEFNKHYYNFLDSKILEDLEYLLYNKNFCDEKRILLLLDGYDESSFDQQCTEFTTYVSSTVLRNPLMFYIVMTTRPGYLSKYRGQQGRFVFADVLGFTTKKQKEKYILNHFQSEIDNENIVAVHQLLRNNKNLDKLAETPLFLTFICLVHERIIDGTIVELYCNIIWWLLDRHQKDFPERDIPRLFGFQINFNDRFRTIQDNYLKFPQLHCLGKMALSKLKENIFQLSESDINQFNLEFILEHVGLLRKDEFYDRSFRLTTTFSFPHRTIQEFLGALYCFISHENTDQWFPTKSEMDTFEMEEFDKFLLRIALSKHISINPSKQKIYFERIAELKELKLDPTFDAINTTAGLNNELFKRLILKCTNIQRIEFNQGISDSIGLEISTDSLHSFKATVSVQNQITFTSLISLHSLSIWFCIFEASFQISFTNCPSLQTLEFQWCEIKSNASIDFSKLPALNTLEFFRCIIDLKTWKSITNKITRSSVKQLKLSFNQDINNELLNHLQKCSNVEKIDIRIYLFGFSKDSFKEKENNLSLKDLINLHSLIFEKSYFEANSQIFVTNCPSLKNLEFNECKIKSSVTIDISKLPALDTVKFHKCTIDLKAWQSITDEITGSSVKELKLDSDFFKKEENSEFFIHLQKCKCIEKITMHILSDSDEQLTIKLSNLAREMKGLKRIIFDDRDKIMKDSNMEIIEKAGQERNPHFKIGSDKKTEEEQEPAKSDPDISVPSNSSTKTDRVEEILPSTSNIPACRELKETEITEYPGQESDPDFSTIFGKQTEGNCDSQGRDKEIDGIKQAESRKRKRQSSSSS